MYILILVVIAVLALFVWIAPDIDEVVGYWEAWEKHEPQEKETKE